jgi:branched-chain amino acid aminotransferase
MGVSPYESPRPALYIIVYAAGMPFMRAHPEGARVKRSAVPVKAGNFATFKHCNYLSNVLMKREAVDAGVDFVVSFDTQGFLAEGATENVGIVTRERALLFPKMEHVLDGTTMLRVMELAQGLLEEGALTRIAFEDISEEMVFSAAELLVIGTTLNVASASHYEGRPIGTACPGPVGKRLDLLLERDILGNPERRMRY